MKIKKLVGRNLSHTHRLLVTEAYNRGVKFERIPKNRRFKMSYAGRSYTVRRGIVSYSYNTRLAIRTVNMKEVTSRILRTRNHSAPENTVFSKHDKERAWDWAKPILPVVLKPYNGSMGRLVFVNINKYHEFVKSFNKIIEKHDEVLIEKFIEGEEYRFTYVNNEIVAVAKRVPANVIGNGINTINQLIDQKNAERKKSGNPIHKKLMVNHETRRVLSKHGYSLDSVPNKGQIVYIRENSNISTGGDAIDVTDEVTQELKERVRKAIRSIPGLRICGADVLIGDSGLFILELNANPMISMHHYPWIGLKRDVASKVIDSMFPDTVKIKKSNSNKMKVIDRLRTIFK